MTDSVSTSLRVRRALDHASELLLSASPHALACARAQRSASVESLSATLLQLDKVEAERKKSNSRQPSKAMASTVSIDDDDDETGNICMKSSQWELRARVYAWGNGEAHQMGSGWDSVAARPLITTSSRPRRVRLVPETQQPVRSFKLATKTATQGSSSSSTTHPTTANETAHEALPVKVVTAGDSWVIVDVQRRLWVVGVGWWGGPQRETASRPLLLGGDGPRGLAAARSVADVACSVAGFTLVALADGSAWIWGENNALASSCSGSSSSIGVRGPGMDARRDQDGEGRLLAPSIVTAIGVGATYSRDATYARSRHSTSTVASGGGVPICRAWLPSQARGGHPLGVNATEQYPLTRPVRLSFALNDVPVVAVAAGDGHALAILADSSVWAWGANNVGSCGVGHIEPVWTPTRVCHTTITQVKNETSTPLRLSVFAVAAGAHHSVALTSDGQVWTWGLGDDGRLGLGAPRIRTSPSDGDKSIIVTSPCRVTSLPIVVSIAAGAAHTLCVAADGRVWACGDNSSGQCGVNTRMHPGKGRAEISTLSHRRRQPPAHPNDMGRTYSAGAAIGSESVLAERVVFIPRPIFTRAFGDVAAVRVFSGARHSGAVSVESVFWLWGANEEAQCGIGDDLSSPEPMPVARFQGASVTGAALGARHTVAIVKRGTSDAHRSLALIDEDDSFNNFESDPNANMITTTATATTATTTDNNNNNNNTSAGVPGALPLPLQHLRRSVLTVRNAAIAYSFAKRRTTRRTNQLRAWKLDPDNCEYGKNAAAHVIQCLYYSWKQKRVALAATAFAEPI